MKRYLLRFYRYFFSSRGGKKIRRFAYFLLFIWFFSIFVQRLIYPEYILSEWYYFYFIYPTLFSIVIFLFPWTRYTLFAKLRLFQIFIFVSIFSLGITIDSLHSFFIVKEQPFTAYPVQDVVLVVLCSWFG